jgi:TatD DNase family protein
LTRRDTSWPPPPEPLPAPTVDNHTHLVVVLAETDGAGWRAAQAAGAELSVPDGGADRFAVAGHLARASAAGVTRIVQVGCDLPAVAWTDRVVLEHPQLVGAVAIHPNEAVLHAGVHEVAADGLQPRPRPHHDVPLDEAITRVADVARRNDRIRAIGETGLDCFRAGERGWVVQREAFRAHIALAKELDLVLQIHDRLADEDVLDVLAADGAPERTVFHCFSGDAEMARYCVERGWYLSYAGTVTYPKGGGRRAALHVTPLDRLLLETDAPYLAPHPFRGRPNAPYLVAATARAVAAELGLGVDAVCEAVSSTSEELYGPW